MSKKYKKNLFLVILCFIFIFSTNIVLVVSAATAPTDNGILGDYVPLEENAFPGVSTDGNKGDLGAFVGQIFNFGIAIAVVLALIEIIWGGVQYMTTDSWYTKSDGKDRIQNAFLGLAIALLSYLLLYTINPELVDFSDNRLFTEKTQK
ncbi:MAG: hypothetical protein WCR40_00515 [Candidatus Paceibacterota bacterium]